jgi:hypothetical protein
MNTCCDFVVGGEAAQAWRDSSQSQLVESVRDNTVSRRNSRVRRSSMAPY